MNDGLFAQGKHKTHRMHENSLRSWRELDHETREYAVCDALRRFGPMTDRQVCTKLGSADMNFCRPAITNLRDQGVIYEHSRTKCETTGRTVRVNGLRGVHDIGSYT